MLLAGTMYFHNSPNSLTTGCIAPPATPRDYNAFSQLQGNPGSSTHILGEIVVDELALGSSVAINMALDPNARFPAVRVPLFQ